MVEVKEMLAPRGSAARPGYAMQPRYITIHNTANTNRGAGAMNHAVYLQHGGAGKTVSWHYAVDDKLITHSIPDNEAAWHAGDGKNGKGNRQSLAIEICENPESNLLKATENAAELTAYLMQKYHIPLQNVVQHRHWKWKNCPRRLRAGQPYSWETFIGRVQWYANGQKAPEKVKLYEITTGPMTYGDKVTMENVIREKAEKLGLPVKTKEV